MMYSFLRWCFICYAFAYFVKKDILESVAGENKSKSIFNVGEITRLLKFPGVKRTFLVKIVAGLPSGES